MRNISGWIGGLALALVATTGCHRAPASAKATTIPTSVQTAPPTRVTDDRKLQPGDCLLVTFHRKTLPQPSTERVIVDAAGDITLPLADKVRVSGLTVEEAHKVIEAAYPQRNEYGSTLLIRLNTCA